MNELDWLNKLMDRYRKTISDDRMRENIKQLAHLMVETSKKGKKTIVQGNGGSAAMASHVAVDMTKCAGMRAINFNEADLITCFANDYGYENWVARGIEFYADEGDLIILISSSGKSPNILNAAKYAKEKGYKTVTLSGFSSENPLRQLGDLNFWAESEEYNVVENSHIIWLLSAVDLALEIKK